MDAVDGTLAAWASIVGFLTPLVVAVATRPDMAPNTKRAIAVVAALVFGVGTAWFNGQLHDMDNLVVSIAVVLGLSQATFNTLWDSIRLKVEAATSPRGARHRGAVAGSGLDD